MFLIRQAIPEEASGATRAVFVGRYEREGRGHDVGPRVGQPRSGAGSRLEIDLSLPEPPDASVTMLLRALGYIQWAAAGVSRRRACYQVGTY